MECAAHRDRASVGYCKKCGRFGCEECLVKVAVTGPVGKKLNATEALICRECLGKARPDLVAPKSGGDILEESISKKPAKHARAPRVTIPVGKIAVGIVACVAIALAIAAAVSLWQSPTAPEPKVSAEEVVSEALAALSAGDVEAFFSYVDVCEFMCRMDTTGLTRRDYAEADRAKIKEMAISHAEFLAKDLFVADNLERDYRLVSPGIGADPASFGVRPWVSYGRRSYRRIVLEKKMGQWWISGLAAPDF